jgi:hypothetical protein
LLQRFAGNIPGAAPVPGMLASAGPDQVRPDVVRQAAQAELAVHSDADTRLRKEAAARARKQLADAEQFFGVKDGFQPVKYNDTGSAVS